MTAPDWPCEAYGPDALTYGAWCFLSSKLDTRVCHTAIACHNAMTVERRALWQRIQQLAAAGDPVAADMAEEFDTPDKLLGGDS